MQTLRDYQLDVVERTRKCIREGKRRVLIQGATGSGKGTIAAYLLARAARMGKRAVFLVHSRRLVTQMAERLGEFGVSCGILMNGFARTSHPIQLVSRDTLFSRVEVNDWMRPPPADLVCLDEAHHSGARYDLILSWYPRAILVGMTATPTWPDGRGMGEPDGPYQALECTIPTSQLVKQGHLARVRCFAPDGAVKKRGEPRKGLVGDPVYWWRKYGAGRPTVLFASRRSESRAACEAFLRDGVSAEHLDGLTPDLERDAILARLRSGETQVLCGVAVLNEGVDLPCVSCIQILRAAGSLVTYLQIAGRGMRPHPSKTDLVLIDHAGACLRHGFPDEDVEWTLDPKDDVNRRNKKAKEDGGKRTPILCPKCVCVYYGQLACPECGHVIKPKRDRKAVVADDVLVEVPREVREADLKKSMYRAWSSYRAIASYRGQKARAASAMFKTQFGVWPEAAGMPDCQRGSDWDRPAAAVWPQFVRRK